MALDHRFMQQSQLGKNFSTHRFTIYLPKQMDGATFGYYKELVERALDQKYQHFEFDFSETEFVSSSGLGCLINLYKKIQEHQGQVQLVNVSEEIRHAFEHANLDGLFNVHEEQALDVDAASGRLHESILKEYNLLATLSKTASRILEVENEEDIPSIILNTLAHHLRSSLGIYLKRRGATGFKWSIETVAGYSFKDLTYLEKKSEQSEIIELHLREGVKPYVLDADTEWPDCPEVLRAVLSDKNVIFVTLHLRGEPQALMIFVLPEWDRTELDNVLHVIANYSSVCALAIENRRLTRQYESKTELLNQTLGKLESTQHSLVEAGKMANLGVVISSLAHHLNNRLVPILGYSQLLRSRHQNLNLEILQKVQKIEASALEVQRVLDSLIGMARQQNLKFSACDLQQLLEVVLNIYDYEFREHNVRLIKNYDEHMPLLKLDGELMEQALLTLLLHVLGNLHDQTEPIIVIETRWERKMALVEVSSNGKPLSHEEQNILLDPFGTMRALDNLKLLNLLVVSEVIKAHRGMIEVRTEDERFVISLLLTKSTES